MKRHRSLRALTEGEKAGLVRLARSRRAAHRLVQRAAAILALAQGCSQRAAAARAALSPSVVALWIERFNGEGIAGLRDRPRSGRPPSYDELSKGRIIQAAKTDPRKLAMEFGHWTLDRLVVYARQHTGISVKRAQIHRWLRGEGLRWRKEQTWFSERSDPQFAEKRAPWLTFISAKGLPRPASSA